MSVPLLQQIKQVYDGTRGKEGLEYIQAVARHMSLVFEFDFVLIGEPSKSADQTVDTIVAVNQGNLSDNFSYALAGTPCDNVLSNLDVCTYPKHVANLFPDDALLEQMGIESYCGAPILNNDNELLGILVVLNNKPFADPTEVATIIDYFGSRIAMYLTQSRYESQLTDSNKLLEESQKRLSEALKGTEELAQAKLEFMTMMSYNLRSPVSSLNDLIEEFEKTELSPTQASLLNHLKHSSEVLNELVDDMTDSGSHNHNVLKPEIS